MAKRGFAIMFVMANGNEDYLCAGLGRQPACFASFGEAKQHGEFIAKGFDDGEYQSMNVVQYPTQAEINAWHKASA